jgi:predicted nuclease of predicted toxin-antitoxin system
LLLIANANSLAFPNMKLLFDQNLSPSLPRLLTDIYAESVHVRTVGLRDASDFDIWQYAKAEGYAIVSKDSDFQQRSLLSGGPPKFSGEDKLR